MYIAVYSDYENDYMSLGETEKEAVESMMLTLKNHAYNAEELLEDFDSEEEFADSEINVYKIAVGETILEGYDIRYKNGKRV